MSTSSLNRKQLILTVTLAGYIFFNLIILSQEIIRLLNYRKIMVHNKIGYQFDGLQQYLKGQDVVGYFSDINLKKDAAGKVFAQAQFMLAPVILDSDNLNHPFIIMVCREPKTAFIKMKQIGAEPLVMNASTGIYLAKKPWTFF